MSDPDELTILRDENTRLRAALAVSKDPCIYCTLPADQIMRCSSGFPGCARTDDIASGCREFGASMDLHYCKERVLQLEALLEEHDITIPTFEDRHNAKDPDHGAETAPETGAERFA